MSFFSLSCLPNSQISTLFSIIFIIFFWSDASVATGADCAILKEGMPTYYLDGSIQYHEDNNAGLSLQEIRGLPASSWATLHETVPSFGFSNSAFWLKFEICSPKGAPEKSVLEISYPLLNAVDLFAIEDGSIVYSAYTGDRILFSERPEKHRNFLFSLPEFQSTMNVYIRVQTESSVQIPLKLYSPAGFFEHNQTSLVFQGCYFGIILALILYNTFLFFSLREWPYLLYVLFITSYFSFQGVLQGFFQQYLFNSVWLQSHSLLFFGFISILFANLFALSFLNLTNKHPVSKWALRSFALASALAALSTPVLPYAPMVKLMLMLAIPSAIFIIAAALNLWWSGHLPARIFTLAWFTLLLSFVLASLSKFGLLPRSFWTENIMQIGGVLEVILLSIALAERINEEKRQRILAEQNLSSSLEIMVQERTIALNEALERLKTVNATLDKISLTDGLTQISNRRAFDSHIQLEYKNAKRTGNPLALIMIDIDHFKRFNDTYGHQVGDEVLITVAQTLQTLATRPRDMVFRYGGEEFAVILTATNLNGATTVAEKMRMTIEQSPIQIEDETCIITISAGISIYDSRKPETYANDLDEFISQADIQLYTAKADGRNRVAPKLERS